MKRRLLPWLLPLCLAAGCESNEPPNTSGDCRGLITVNLEPAATLNKAKAIESTWIGPTGVRYTQLDTPPLPLPNVLLRVREQYQTGTQYVRVAAAESDPSRGTASAPAAVTAVARTTTYLTGACPSVRLALQATGMLDICLDRCDAELRCGQLPFDRLTGCHAECRVNEAQFAQQEADWKATYQNATEVINKLAGCNAVACGAIEACGETVMKSAVPKP